MVGADRDLPGGERAGFFVQSYAQQHASPARTALILASEPVFAGFFGYLLADERLSAVSWVGAALILASIVAVELVPRLSRPDRCRRRDDAVDAEQVADREPVGAAD